MRVRQLTLLLIVLTGPVMAEDAVPPAYSENPVVRGGNYVLWHDPGPVERLDFRYGIGGAELAPQAPYTFLGEDTTGTNPKVKVRDGRGRTWVIKFGEEASSDVFSTRLAWALGYYVEPAYYVTEGEI